MADPGGSEGFAPGPAGAVALDRDDPFAHWRDRFAIPRDGEGHEAVYLAGHSLGLQPAGVRQVVNEELDKWAELGVRGHFESDRPWAPYHEPLAAPMARLVGALPEEVVVMNGLTVNLHLLMVSFYRPTPRRNAILIEKHAFPSDHYAAESQIRFHGHDPAEALVLLEPRPGEDTLRRDDVVARIEELGDRLALVLLPGVQYYTGQVLPMPEIVDAAHRAGAFVGLDLAHAAGNIPLELHAWGPDFAAWCTYKYLNSGPGAAAAAFVHQRHLGDPAIPRFHGWWGHDKATRFEMGPTFVPIPTAEAWQLSNAPVLSMAPLYVSLGVFEEAGGVAALRTKSERMSRYLDFLLAERLEGLVERITPQRLEERGCQASLRVVAPGRDGHDVFARLEAAGVEADWRHPDVIRAAPVPLYNRFADVYRLVAVLEDILT